MRHQKGIKRDPVGTCPTPLAQRPLPCRLAGSSGQCTDPEGGASGAAGVRSWLRGALSQSAPSQLFQQLCVAFLEAV